MVSMVETSHPTQNDMAMDPVVPKTEPLLEGSISSAVSTPDPEGEVLTPDVAQTQKRKGGRKPIYATSEERKQRNRQAQAAFRERRTEYIRQLESTIKHNEETLQTLQQNHRTAADECLMLRYKNSLLERILLEKGIDVQAELRLKAATPSAGPGKPSPMSAKTPSLQQAAVNRNSAQRHPSGLAPKEPFSLSQSRDGYGMPSPQFQATPPSHVSSPSHAKSPGYGFQTTFSSTTVDPQAQHARSQMLSHSRNISQSSPPVSIGQPEPTEPKSSGLGPRGAPGDRPHITRLLSKNIMTSSQEYDAQVDMIDEEHDSSVSASPFVPGFNANAPVPGASHPMTTHGITAYHSHSGEGPNGAYGTTSSLLGNYEPMLDADPFGLSASMHFQTPFSYEQNNSRQ
ncbi:bZIP transcription factor (MeaB) [Aspergillus rambellii]|uniref:BZIP transcription factor (MeaB) n=1 Tax=Aspergillus rambellii TaxID=308745 RepID=A0A0F8V534_9EURO|nr:bZIP transcription factor (MeaB) [Aspergillus rambellii]